MTDTKKRAPRALAFLRDAFDRVLAIGVAMLPTRPAFPRATFSSTVAIKLVHGGGHVNAKRLSGRRNPATLPGPPLMEVWPSPRRYALGLRPPLPQAGEGSDRRATRDSVID